MTWINESSSDVKKRILSGFDESLGGTNKVGSFWTDELKKNKSNPYKRYEIAINALPYPAAFREAVLGLRAIIREKNKAGEDYDQYVKKIYELAVWNSFSMDYSEKAKSTGYSILERIPGSVITNLTYSYKDIGYGKLTLINKTDAKNLVNLWGEPTSHNTLLDLHQDVWNKYERDYIENKNELFTHLLDERSNPNNEIPTRSTNRCNENKGLKGLFKSVFGRQ